MTQWEHNDEPATPSLLTINPAGTKLLASDVTHKIQTAADQSGRRRRHDVLIIDPHGGVNKQAKPDVRLNKPET